MKDKLFQAAEYEDMSVGMLLHHATRTHLERIHNALEKYGVQKTFGPILKTLSETEGISQSTLAEMMRVTAPSMSVSLQKMENAGLLLRKSDGEDMRQIRLYLTEAGRETAQKAEREIKRVDAMLIEGLTQEEQKIFKRILIKILNSLNETTREV